MIYLEILGMIYINTEYTKEPLIGGRVIYVSADSRFGTDAVLLASFAQPKHNDKAVDLCTGGGIIPLLWLGKNSIDSLVYGVELQSSCCELARLSIAENHDEKGFEVIEGDLRHIDEMLPRENFSLVTCNPPYFTAGSGAANKSDSRMIARSELTCNSDDVCRAAKYLLKYGGRLCICQRPERMTDVVCAMRANGIEPKRIRLVQQRYGREPWLVLIEGRRGGKPGVKFLPVLIVEDEQGEYTSEMREIYGRYGEESKWQEG